MLSILTMLLRLYPPAWRERYEQEMIAVLEMHKVTPLTLLDLLLGALDARLDPQYRAARSTTSIYTLHPASLTLLWVFPIFMLCICYSVWQLQDPPGAFYGSLDAVNDITNGMSTVSVSYIVINSMSIVSVSYTVMFASFVIVMLSALVDSLLLASLTVRKAIGVRGRMHGRVLVKYISMWLLVLVTAASFVGIVWSTLWGHDLLLFVPLICIVSLASLWAWLLTPERGEISRRGR